MDQENKQEGTSIYVGNLAWATTDQGLRDFFQSYGVVESASVSMTDSGRSKGWGLVNFADNAAAANAIDSLAEGSTELDGRAIFVKWDRGKRPPRQQQQQERGPDTPCNVVYVGNIPFATTSDELWNIYSQHQCTAAEVQTGRDGRSRGFGLITFNSPEEAQAAIDSTQGTELGGRPINARFDRMAAR